MIVPKSPTTQDDIRPCCPADPPAATTPHIVTRSSELLAISDWLTMPHRDQPSSRSHSHLHAQPLYVTYHLEALGNTTTTRFWTRERPLNVPPRSRTQASLSFCQFLPFGSLVTRYAGQEEGIYPARSFLAPPSTDTFQAKSELPHFTTTSFPANQPSTSKSKNACSSPANA